MQDDRQPVAERERVERRIVSIGGRDGRAAYCARKRCAPAGSSARVGALVVALCVDCREPRATRARTARCPAVVRNPAARRAPARDGAGDQLRADHLRGRRRDAGSGRASRPRPIGYLYARRPRAQRSLLRPVARAGAGVLRRRLVQLAAGGGRARRSDRERLLRRSDRRRRACWRSRAGLDTTATSAAGGLRIDWTAGTTFNATPLYTAPPSGDVVGVEIARSNPNIVYVAMYTTPGAATRSCVRSDDGGRTLDRHATSRRRSAPTTFRILAVDPRRSPTSSTCASSRPGVEKLAVTRDAGATFTTPLTVTGGVLSAFARLASGTVLVGGVDDVRASGGIERARLPLDGRRRRPSSPGRYAPSPTSMGLAERGGVVYLAGKNYSDGWALATSTDEGVTIQPLANYDEVRGVRRAPGRCARPRARSWRCRRVWTSDVCTGALLDGGVRRRGRRRRKPPPPPGGCPARRQCRGVGRRARARPRRRCRARAVHSPAAPD